MACTPYCLARFLRRRPAEGHQPVTVAHQLVGGVKDRAADGVDDDVDTGYFLLQLAVRGAYEPLRAQAPHETGICAAAGRSDMTAEERGELDRERPHSPGAAVHQHPLARFDGRVVDQGLPGGQRRERQRGRLRVQDRPGRGRQLTGGEGDRSAMTARASSCFPARAAASARYTTPSIRSIM